MCQRDPDPTGVLQWDKILFIFREYKPDCQAVQPAGSHSTDRAVPAL